MQKFPFPIFTLLWQETCSGRTECSVCLKFSPRLRPSITDCLSLDLVCLALSVVSNLGHDVLLALHTDRQRPAVPDLDLALHLLRHESPGTAGAKREVCGGVSVHLVVIPRPRQEPPPGVVLSLLRGVGVAGAGGAGAGAVDERSALTEPAGALPAHLTGGPVVVITEVGDVLQVAVGVLLTAAVLGPVLLLLLLLLLL